MDHDDTQTTTEVRPYSNVDAEVELRHLLAYSRAEAVDHRTDDPVRGRQMAMIATHVEDALRILLMPVP